MTKSEILLDSDGVLVIFTRDVSVLRNLPEFQGLELPANLGTGPLWCRLTEPLEFSRAWVEDPPMPTWWQEAWLDAMWDDVIRAAGMTDPMDGMDLMDGRQQRRIHG